MKKIFFLLIITLTPSIFVKAQTPNFAWVKSMGGSGFNTGNSIITDANGNVYTTGYFEGVCDFDPGVGTYYLASNGGWEIFVQKLDPSGNFIWAVSMGGASNDGGNGIVADSSGNVYITGFFQNTVDFDPGPGTYYLTSDGNYDIFVLKLDASGNLIWAVSMGGQSTQSAHGLAVDPSGYLYITGEFYGTTDFDPGTGTNYITSNGILDIFTLKMDSTGDVIWVKSMGGTAIDRGYAIAADDHGNVYTAGVFNGTVDFNPGVGAYNLSSNGNEDIFIQKLDSLGNFIWAVSIGNANQDYVSDMAVDIHGNIYTTGWYYGTLDFDPGIGIYNLSTNGEAIFILKLDGSGNFLWAKSMGDSVNNEGYAISLDAIGNVYSTGRFQNTVDFDPDTSTYYLTSNGHNDVFVQKLDTAGNLVWAINVGGTSRDNGNGITIDKYDNILLTGLFSSTVDFDPGAGVATQICNGYNDVFVLKLSQCQTSFYTFTDTACNFYTVPSGDETYTVSGIYSDTIPNAKGCDSIITINLTIVNIDTSVTCFIAAGQLNTTLQSNHTNASYQWLDCNNGFAALPGDTLQTFTPILNGDYAVGIYVSGCADTSACMHIGNVSIEEIEGSTIKLYPNPNSGKFMLDLGNLKATEVKILNCMGQEIWVVREINSQYFNLELKPGVYFLLIRTAKAKRTIKFVVK